MMTPMLNDTNVICIGSNRGAPPSVMFRNVREPTSVTTGIVSAGTNSACVDYAKVTCDKTSLDACRDAVEFVNTQPSAATDRDR